MKRSDDLVIARDRVIGKTRVFFRTLRAALLEIFDESAYTRFLERTSAERTRQSYLDFRREYESSAARRPRCC